MQNIGKKPILAHIIERFKQVSKINDIVLAISKGPASAVFVDFAEQYGLPYVIGDEKDVLGRVITGAESVNADIVVRHTTENPFIYYEVLDELIQRTYRKTIGSNSH